MRGLSARRPKKSDRSDLKKRIIALSARDFGRAWRETRKLLEKGHPDRMFPRLRARYGKPHPVFETIQRLREIYLRLGFDEVINPLIVEDSHVYNQFGPEAAAVLDRCFYLATLPKPNVGLGREKIEILREMGVDLSEEKLEKLREVLHSYKKGEISGDDLSHEIARALSIDSGIAVDIIERAFPEIRELKPEPTNLTLRSHMTSGWFITLSKVKDKLRKPIKLFSIDRCFRREQREGPTRLYTYHSASCIYADSEVPLDVGKSVAEAIARQLGFREVRFVPDEKMSKYYIAGSQTEVYVRHPKLGWIEIATFGLYSPIALSRYGIDDLEVMNLGMGVERVAMILYGYDDVRSMVYGYAHGEWIMDDLDIAEGIYIDRIPHTEEGLELMRAIVRVAEERANEIAPCSFKVFEGRILGRKVRVELFEDEEGERLLGPAAFNEIRVEDGNVIGTTEDRGISTGIRFIDGIAADIASRVEEEILLGERSEFEHRVDLVRSLRDINVSMDDVSIRYIHSKRKRIDVRGPVFLKARIRIE